MQLYDCTIMLVNAFVKLQAIPCSFVSQDGIPRTAYKGVVVFRHQTQRRVFLIAPDSLKRLGI